MGLWEGGGFRSHLHTATGTPLATLSGAIFAVNTAVYWPVDTPKEVVATSLYLTQKLVDDRSLLQSESSIPRPARGRPFLRRVGHRPFHESHLRRTAERVHSRRVHGGDRHIKTEPVSWTVMVFDPKDRTNDYFPGDLFTDGVNVSVTGAHTTTLAGRKTTYAVTVNYSTAPGTKLPRLPPGMETTTKKGSYNVAFEFSHTLQENPGGRMPTGGSTSRGPLLTAIPTTYSHRSSPESAVKRYFSTVPRQFRRGRVPLQP